MYVCIYILHRINMFLKYNLKTSVLTFPYSVTTSWKTLALALKIILRTEINKLRKNIVMSIAHPSLNAQFIVNLQKLEIICQINRIGRAGHLIPNINYITESLSKSKPIYSNIHIWNRLFHI